MSEDAKIVDPAAVGDIAADAWWLTGLDVMTFGVFGADTTTAKAVTVQSLSARFGARLGGFDFSVFADNLTNAHPELVRYHETTASTVFRGRTLRPRTFGLTAVYAF